MEHTSGDRLVSVLGPSLGYPFALGAATLVNPCGVALLPVYLSSLLGELPKAGDDPPGGGPPHCSSAVVVGHPGCSSAAVDGHPGTSIGARLRRALVTAAAATAGFVVLFTAVGLPVSAGADAAMAALPEVMLGVAGVLVLAGIVVLAGRHIGVPLPELHGVWRRARRPVARGALFGVAYAVASLGCALPLFLAGVAGSLTRGGILHGLAAFVAYGLGMGAMFSVVSVVGALGGAGMARWLRQAARWFDVASGVALVAAGGYLADYWGADLAGRRVPGFVRSMESLDARAGPWLAAKAPWIAAGLGVAIVVAIGLAAAGVVVRRAAHDGGASARAGMDAASGSRSRMPRRRVVTIAMVSATFAALGGALGISLAMPTASAGPRPGVSTTLADMVSLDPLSSPLHLAPTFTLTDQRDQRVSLDELRGDAVVLAFNDDRCKDLCPLYAADVRAADRDLGRAGQRHVVFLSVNANPYYPQVRYVRAWSDQHDMASVPNWLFATGSVPLLEHIWAEYGEEVERDAATRTVNHGTVFYVIGPGGHERDVAEFAASSVRTRPWGYTLARLAEDTLPSRERTPLSNPVFVDPILRDQARPRLAPSFSLPLLTHPTSTVSSARVQGHPVLLSFWASWCPDCRADLPVLNRVAHDDRGIEVVGVAVDTSTTAAGQLARRDHLSFTLAVDASGDLAERYGIDELPTTFLVGPNGRVEVELAGTLTAGEVHQIVTEATAASHPAASP